MKRWLWIAVLVAAGCNGPLSVSRSTCERISLPLMSDVQRAEYYRRPTWAERKAYLYEIDILQKFESAPTSIQRAILYERVVEGMDTDQVVMSWGEPVIRVVLKPSEDPAVARETGRQERWLYSRVLTSDLNVRYLRAVEFTNGVVIGVRDERRRP